jgi:bifunctional DNA-binding transcriptional regulator/antitoxin component of YhaV-PrlF toxin-antitoxin module
MSVPASSNDGVEVVVDPSGAVVVPASVLARYGYRPGAHLRLVSDAPAPVGRKSMRGAFAHLVTDADLDAFESAMSHAKAERVAGIDTKIG